MTNHVSAGCDCEPLPIRMPVELDALVGSARLEALRLRLNPRMPRMEPQLWISAVGALALGFAAIFVALM
jgi:hypothetical protein